MVVIVAIVDEVDDLTGFRHSHAGNFDDGSFLDIRYLPDALYSKRTVHPKQSGSSYEEASFDVIAHSSGYEKRDAVE